MRTVQSSQFRQLFLRDALRLANLLNPPGHRALDVVLQSIRLWRYAALKHPALKQHI